MGQFTLAEWFVLTEHELLLFAAVFFAFGVIDELAVDIAYIWLRLTGRGTTAYIDEKELPSRTLTGPAAVFIPTWQESAVIGPTIAHLLTAWPQDSLRLYVGCYRNDTHTLASALVAARGDCRVRLVVHGRDGPTSKADCLNRLYRALCQDEARSGVQMRMVLLHDAEDMVDPAALALLDSAISDAEFVQLPVMALPQSNSRLIGSHYSDEFAEAHGKTLVVRDALGAAVPGAGVGCAIARAILVKIGSEPFARDSLTEDYELGLAISSLGGRSRFLRCRAQCGRLIATRAFFPARLDVAVRQKTRWMHGIALQSWDRLGWSGSGVNLWMQLRDRRGPLAAILLAVAYVLVVTVVFTWAGTKLGILEPVPFSPMLKLLLVVNFLGFIWRALARARFTGREYGWREGLLAIPRTFVSNIIGIMAGRRALVAYIRTLRGAPMVWDKTDHRDHPAMVNLDHVS